MDKTTSLKNLRTIRVKTLTSLIKLPRTTRSLKPGNWLDVNGRTELVLSTGEDSRIDPKLISYFKTVGRLDNHTLYLAHYSTRDLGRQIGKVFLRTRRQKFSNLGADEKEENKYYKYFKIMKEVADQNPF